MLMIAMVVLMAAPISAWAVHLAGETGHTSGQRLTEDVRNTLHNLGGGGSTFNNPNILPSGSATQEVCVFCHTPHGANTTSGAAPLWNRALPSSSGYTTYSSPNFDSGSTGQPYGVSLACLSCHDGTVALDALINASGSGGFFGATPASNNTINPDSGSTMLLDAGTFSSATRTTGGEANYAAMTGAAPFPNLTINLSDDHPISFAMGSTDPQFDSVSVTDSGSITLISNGASSGVPTDKRDAVRLYPATGGNSNAGNKTDWVECASCHNPHAPRPLFLRLPSAAGLSGVTSTTTIPTTWGGDSTIVWADGPNRGSAVCLSCHTK